MRHAVLVFEKENEKKHELVAARISIFYSTGRKPTMARLDWSLDSDP
jgi:hypothetical protein